MSGGLIIMWLIDANIEIQTKQQNFNNAPTLQFCRFEQ